MAQEPTNGTSGAPGADAAPADGSYLPTILVGWDAPAQTVRLHFNPQEFRQWDFVVMVLRAAVDKAETQRRLAQMQALQAGAKEQAVADAIRKSLRG